jgi:histone H3/H4
MSSSISKNKNKAKKIIEQPSKSAGGNLIKTAPFKREIKMKLKEYSAWNLNITADALQRAKVLVETYILHMLKSALAISVNVSDKLTVGDKELQLANQIGCAYFTGNRGRIRLPEKYKNQKGKKYLFSEKSIRDMAKYMGIKRLSKDAIPFIRYMIHECTHDLAKYSNIVRSLTNRKTINKADINYAFSTISRQYAKKYISDAEN